MDTLLKRSEMIVKLIIKAAYHGPTTGLLVRHIVLASAHPNSSCMENLERGNAIGVNWRGGLRLTWKSTRKHLEWIQRPYKKNSNSIEMDGEQKCWVKAFWGDQNDRCKIQERFKEEYCDREGESQWPYSVHSLWKTMPFFCRVQISFADSW